MPTIKRRSFTDAVHAGRGEFRALGVHAPPIDLSSTYPLDDLVADGVAFEQWSHGAAHASNPIYARLHNPTVARFEAAVAELESAPEAVAFASGMATVTACLLAACRERRHVVALRPLYGGTDQLLGAGLLGLDATWVDDPRAIRDAVGPDTGLVIVESPGNPTLDVVDLDAVVAAAGATPVLVDNTFATPVLQRPLLHGAAFSLHSATKFLGGHGDVIAGVVATTPAHAAALRTVRILTGGILHPLAAYLLHRGLPTLPLRVERAQENAAELAARLRDEPAVARVRYPGLDGPLPAQLAGGGCVLALELAGGHAAAVRFVEALELVTHAVSLGSVDTLVQHPAGFSHRLAADDVLERHGITGGLLRLSVGVEDVDDLWADLKRGLDAAAAAR